MLNNQEEVEKFKAYQSAGGIQQSNVEIISRGVLSKATALNSALNDAVNLDLNYAADGIEELPQQIQNFCGECAAAIAAITANIDYLAILSNPSDLEIISIGTDIARKLAGEGQGESLAISPLVDSNKITLLSSSVSELDAHKAAIVDLMARINSAITPVAPPPSAEGEPVPPPVAPPLPSDLKTEAMDMIAALRDFLGLISASAKTLTDFISAAIAEKDQAEKAFKSCIQFTLLNGQKQNPIISSAADALYPIINR